MVSELHLGGCGENYKWTQTEEEIICEIRVKELMQEFKIDMDLGKDIKETKVIKNYLKVKIGFKSIEILLKEVCVFNKELSSKIDLETAAWYLEEDYKYGKSEDRGVILMIILEKKKKGWWDSCFLGEDKINLSQVQGRKNFKDCDDRTRTEILKLINSSKNSNISYNEEKKDTNIENTFDIHQILKQSWNMENSPFQGIEYDPKLVKELIGNTNINQSTRE